MLITRGSAITELSDYVVHNARYTHRIADLRSIVWAHSDKKYPHSG